MALQYSVKRSGQNQETQNIVKANSRLSVSISCHTRFNFVANYKHLMRADWTRYLYGSVFYSYKNTEFSRLSY